MVTVQSYNTFENREQSPYYLQKNSWQTTALKRFSDRTAKILLINLIEVIVHDICKGCNEMASLPQGAFAACKLRELYRNRDLVVARRKSSTDKNDSKFMSSNKKLMEYSPVKYNEKLMNSIWSLYNRYSPHNIKTNEYVPRISSPYQQQQNAVAPTAIAHNLAMATTSGKEWHFPMK